MVGCLHISNRLVARTDGWVLISCLCSIIIYQRTTNDRPLPLTLPLSHSPVFHLFSPTSLHFPRLFLSFCLLCLHDGYDVTRHAAPTSPRLERQQITSVAKSRVFWKGVSLNFSFHFFCSFSFINRLELLLVQLVRHLFWGGGRVCR